MLYEIQERQTLNILPCKCGAFPEFIIPNDHYTDCWLKCPICEKRTMNTGGFYYAQEISLREAKIKAITLWNNGEYNNE